MFNFQFQLNVRLLVYYEQLQFLHNYNVLIFPFLNINANTILYSSI